MYRKLIPAEAAALCAHLMRLKPEERLTRFMGAISDESVSDYCDRIDWYRTVVIGFFESGTLRGAVEVHLGPVHPNWFHVTNWCEIGITVESAWQEHGVATELLRRGLVVARNRGASGLKINCYGDNYRMQHVAQKFGAHFRRYAGQSDADIVAAPATAASLYEEALDNGAGWLGFWCDVIAASPLRFWVGLPLPGHAPPRDS
jgi:RimJ/RimL family protein N-acetyltransferase